MPRFFRPQVLEAFHLTNTALGDAFAVYGVTAMLAYFPGGLLADRFPARGLLAASLAATAAGGLYFATQPGPTGLTILYGYWGITTILLLWGAMIRATREWGGRLQQGRAFGLLDGGRGLVAAVLSSLALLLLRGGSLRGVILFYTAVTAASAVLCWFAVPASSPVAAAGGTAAAGTAAASTRATDASAAGAAAGRWWPSRTVWWQAAIVVCAYCGYKGLDYYALMASQTLGLSALEAAEWFSATAYLRPVAAIAAGWIADRHGAHNGAHNGVSRTVSGLFALGLAGYALLAGVGSTATLWWAANLLLTIVAVYALRGVYFALLEETRVDAARTGMAVGIISLVGYAPDAFFAPIAGRLLDAAPGVAGFRLLCGLLAVIFALGAVAAARLGAVAAVRLGAEASVRLRAEAAARLGRDSN